MYVCLWPVTSRIWGVTPWLFSMWGMDVIGPITPKASNGHRFIFIVIDYFTKWVETASNASGHVMVRQIMRAGYYWMTLESDCINYVWKCHKCQIYADKIHVPPTSLNVIVSPWPFSMWGMDVIEPIILKALNDHRFIFVVIDYFTKWVEATSYASVTKSVVARFIKREIIC